MDRFGLVRALLGPALIAVVLVSIGYGAVAWNQSHPAYFKLKGISMAYVGNQGLNGPSWNITIANNGTLGVLLGLICQMYPSSNACPTIGPGYWGTFNVSDAFLAPGQTRVLILSTVGTNLSVWQFHIDLWPWTSNSPPTQADLYVAGTYEPPEAVWLFYNSTSRTFI